MKTPVKAALFAALLVGSAGAASAQLLGVQLGSNPGYTGVGKLGESFVPSAGPGSGNQSRTTPLGSGVIFTISNPGAGNNYAESETSAANTLANNLFTSDNVIFNPGNSLTFTFTGLTAGSTYNLALYAGDLGDRKGDDRVNLTVNGTAVTPVGAVYGNNAFILNTATIQGNYEIVPAIANVSGAITIVGSDAGPSGYAEIAGFGIQSVPEPSSWVASLLGGFAVLVGVNRMRRRHA